MNKFAKEALAAEKAVADRQQNRKLGYAKMKERDEGGVFLSNGVEMRWPVDREIGKSKQSITLNGKKHEVVSYPRAIPEGKFTLVLAGKEILFDTEEFRRSLRWV